jgi:outer membrane protein TolC
MIAARWLVFAADNAVHAARAAFYPDINLALFAGWNSIHLGDLLSPVNWAHAVGPAVTLPLFEGHALRAQLAIQRAAYLAARDHYRRVLLTAVREVADNVSDWTQTARELKAAQDAVESARHQQQLAAGAYAAGLTNRLPVLRAQLTATRESLTTIPLQRARGQAWAKLEEALGGGYHITPTGERG